MIFFFLFDYEIQYPPLEIIKKKQSNKLNMNVYLEHVITKNMQLNLIDFKYLFKYSINVAIKNYNQCFHTWEAVAPPASSSLSVRSSSSRLKSARCFSTCGKTPYTYSQTHS